MKSSLSVSARHRRGFIIFCFVAAVLPLSVWATLIVDWGGNYVTGSRNLNLPSSSDNGGVRTFEYSATTPITPTTDYNPPAGRTGPIYGGLQNTSDDGTARNFGAARVSNLGDNDGIYLQGNSGVGGSIQGMFFFIKADFLNGYDSVTLSLDGLEGSYHVAQLAESGSFRFAVLNGSSWYVSESVQTTTGEFTITDMGAANWGAWDPAGAPLDALPSQFNTTGSSLNNVGAFGFYLDASRGSSAPSMTVDAFQITAIPEPEALLYFGVGILAFWLRRRIGGRACRPPVW